MKLRDFVIEGFIAATSAMAVCVILPIEGMMTGAIAGLTGYCTPEIYKYIRK